MFWGVFGHVPNRSFSRSCKRALGFLSGHLSGAFLTFRDFPLSVPQPQFDVASITPFKVGHTDQLIHFSEENLSAASQSRTPLNRVAGLTQAQLDNPNLFLSTTISPQTILSTTVLRVTSDTRVPGSIPNVGGGMDNIAFLTGVGAPPAGGPNAIAAFAEATFWIERVSGEYGNPDFNQLQYTQRVLLNFNELSWPHITVATLRKM